MELEKLAGVKELEHALVEDKIDAILEEAIAQTDEVVRVCGGLEHYREVLRLLVLSCLLRVRHLLRRDCLTQGRRGHYLGRRWLERHRALVYGLDKCL